jgi:hypothetical protein
VRPLAWKGEEHLARGHEARIDRATAYGLGAVNDERATKQA